jgi:hypothetical protein
MYSTLSHSLSPWVHARNGLGNKSFMHPMRRLNMRSWGVSCFGRGGARWARHFWYFSLFSSRSHRVPKLLLRTFSIAPNFYSNRFAQSSTQGYIKWKGESQWRTFVSILGPGVQRGASMPRCSQKKLDDEPINMAPSKLNCEHSQKLSNRPNYTMSHSKQSSAKFVKSLIPTVSPVWTSLESIEQMHSWSSISLVCLPLF